MSAYIRIFVGLGGFGSSVVQKLYKIVKEENKGIIPDYVKFATYDSAMNEKPSYEDFPNAIDFMKASPDGPQEFLLECKDSYKFFDQWWPGIWEEKDQKKLWWTSDLIWGGKGLGQYRPFGRLGFYKHLTQPDNIIGLVNRLLSEASEVLKKSKNVNAVTPRIIIINSLAGGTGSSAFLDVAQILKDEISKLNKSLEIILFTVTGEASMKGRASETSDAYQWALANSYAALTELDYFAKDDSSSLKIEYPPPYGEITLSPPVIKHVGLICQKNQSAKELPKFKDYIKFLADTLNVIAVRITSNQSFDSVFDNILQHMKRYGSFGLGSIHYRYKDGLLYEFSLFVEESMANSILASCGEKVKTDIENELDEELKLFEEGYYFENVNNLNYNRKDSIFHLLEKPYEDDRKLKIDFPFISLAKLEKKITHESLQQVLRDIRELDNEIIKFLDVKKKVVYDIVRSAIKSNLFFNKNQPISYIKEYLIQIKQIIDARVIGLERDLPQVFEEIHYKKIQMVFNEKVRNLEKKQNNKALEEFQDSFKKYCDIKKLVFKSKAKLEIYKNLSSQLEWYVKSVEEVYKPTEESLLKHYRMVKEGLQIGTYDEQYKKDQFTIYAFPLEDNKNTEKYKNIYNDFSIKKSGEKDQLTLLLSNTLVKSIVEGINSIPSLLEIYKVQPVWSDETNLIKSEPQELNYDKREALKNYLKRSFRAVMEGEFQKYMTEFLPQNAVEALFFESQVARRYFKDLLDNKIKELDFLVDPFVILGQETKDIGARTPITNLIFSKYDLQNLFDKYGQAEEDYGKESKSLKKLAESKQEILDGILKGCSKVETENLEKATLLKIISGFELESVAAYNNLFKPAYDKLKRYESFADIRLKPGKSTKEIIFLMSEYYGIIESKEPHFKFDGKALETSLKGRGNVIKWFLEERDSSKIKRIKNKLKIIWNKIPNSDKQVEFENIIKKLEEKKRNVVDESLRKIIEDNILTMEHALNFKYYETIHKEFE